MLAIVDSGGANIASVRFALERLGVASELTADPAVIRAAEDRRSASAMTISSIRLSLAGFEVGWMMYMSSPRTFS